jgi:hypothetical protein
MPIEAPVTMTVFLSAIASLLLGDLCDRTDHAEGQVGRTFIGVPYREGSDGKSDEQQREISSSEQLEKVETPIRGRFRGEG